MVAREQKIKGQGVKVIVLRTAGTNCDQETGFAFKNFGADVDFVHINQLFTQKVSLHDYHILAIPGGFSYGDDVAAGRILGNELRIRLGDDIKKFVAAGKLVIGICNGFQILVKAGILPGVEGEAAGYSQGATLMINDSGKFEDRWIHLQVSGRSAWTEGLDANLFLPVAHAEGKFVPKSEAMMEKLRKNGQIVFCYSSPQGKAVRYPENPNGSVENIAGVCDPTGRILGLMPHPERHFFFTQHPFWTRLADRKELGDGARIFENGINYIRNKFLKS